MIEVHLIGYTADLRHLVLDVDANEERGRYRLVVDGDLFATLDDVRQQRWEHGLDVGVWAPEDAEWEDEESDVEAAADDEDEADVVDEAPAAAAQAAPDDDEDDLLADLEDSPVADPPQAQDTSQIRPFDRDAPLFDEDDEDQGEADGALDALLDRVSVDSDDDAPSVRLVPAPTPEPEPEPEPEDEPEYEYEYEEPEAVEPEPVAADVVEPEILEDEEWEWVEESVEVDLEEPAAQDEAAEVSASEEPTPRVRNSDIPTALPSQLAKRKTAAGLEIPQNAKLSPAEIQAELRKGRSARAVAKAAGTDLDWVKRWLQPIEAEQTRIIEQARKLTVTSRKGQVSALPLAQSAELRLTRRGVDPETAKWDAVRREDGTWKISCKFEEKGKTRTASWLWARGETRLSPASELAREVGWVDRRLAAKR